MPRPRSATPPPELTSVGWVRMAGGRLLVVRTRGRDRFYLPGGKLEPGESPEEALMREVREELGVVLRELRPAFTVEAAAHGLAEPTRLTMRCFHGEFTGQLLAAGEIEEIAWLDAPDDPRAAPAVRDVLARVHSTDAGRSGA